jgi:hypothetical protein
MGSGYNRTGARLIPAGVAREYGQSAVDRLIQDLDLETVSGIQPGTGFRSARA